MAMLKHPLRPLRASVIPRQRAQVEQKDAKKRKAAGPFAHSHLLLADLCVHPFKAHPPKSCGTGGNTNSGP